jgi:cytosine/adenosine deaminase-related metal-dependent hydrolase
MAGAAAREAASPKGKKMIDISAREYVLAPRLVLTPEGPQNDAVIVVREGKVSAVVPRAELDGAEPSVRAMPVIDLPDMAVIPGFVDAHAHAGQTFGKALICGEPMQIWRRLWIPLENALTPERSYVSAKWIFLEALRGGFTTLVNFNRNDPACNEAVHHAARDTGIRLVSGVAASTTSPGADAVIGWIEEHRRQCEAVAMIYPSLCFGFYGDDLSGLSLEDLSRVGRYCRDEGILLQMHSNEHFPDVHDCITRFGKRPIELWSELGILNECTLLHHAALVSAREVALVAENGAAISYNPVASQWKGNAVAPALQYLQQGARVGLGTDNTRMDAFRNLDAAENCQRLAFGLPVLDFSCGEGWSWVDAGTRGSADAAGLGKVTGEIRPGLAADLLVLRMNVPEVVPSWDFEWELVRFYNRDQIEAVIVEGRLVMERGRSSLFDSSAFVGTYEELARDMMREADPTRAHATSSTLRPPR